MRITFVGIGWEQFGISLLSAIAKQSGHEVNLAFSVSLFNDRSHLTCGALAKFFDDTGDVLTSIQRQQPDVLAFSPVSGTYQAMIRIAQEAKRLFPEVKTIFGGVHPSALPEHVLSESCVDYVCVGEGEIAFPQILAHIQDGGSQQIANTRYKMPDGRISKGPQLGFFQDLDRLPIFDKTIWEEHMRFQDAYLTMASRGCPFRCTYCFNSFFPKLHGHEAGSYVRYRSPDHMLHELNVAKRRYNFRSVEFFDDVFTLDKKWLKEFLGRYKKEIGVAFQCFTHIQCIDEEVGRWLNEAGCRAAQIGLQTLDEDYKNMVLHRREGVADFEKAMVILKKYHILPKLDHMLGLPGEPLTAMEKAREFYVKFPPYRIQTYWFNPYPGTEILQRMVAEGFLAPDDVRRINNGECFDSFTNSNDFIDRKKIRIYKAYELIFKIIPASPLWLRQVLRPRIFQWLPAFVISVLSFMADLLIGFARWDMDHFNYAKYYLYHIGRFVFRKLGGKIKPATPVIVDQTFDLPVRGRAIPENNKNGSRYSLEATVGCEQ